LFSVEATLSPFGRVVIRAMEELLSAAGVSFRPGSGTFKGGKGDGERMRVPVGLLMAAEVPATR
jgi:hypothetical protein